MTIDKLVPRRSLLLLAALAATSAYACGADEGGDLNTGGQAVGWECEYIGDRADFCNDSWECASPQRILRLDCEYERFDEGATSCDCYDNGMDTGGYAITLDCNERDMPLQSTNNGCGWKLTTR
jgi:hypothetical protein